MKTIAMSLAAFTLAALSQSAVAESAEDYRQMERDAVRQMQAAKDRDDRDVWRHKAEFYRDQATRLEVEESRNREGVGSASRQREDSRLRRHLDESEDSPGGSLNTFQPAPAPAPKSKSKLQVQGDEHPRARSPRERQYDEADEIRAQEAPTCPPGTVVYGDSCKRPSEICETPRGRGLMLAGRCEVGARP